MKKAILFCISAILLAGSIWGQAPNDGKILNIAKHLGENSTSAKLFSGKTVYFFSGFDFGGYEAKDPNLQKLNEGERNAIYGKISNAKVTPVGSNSYSIVSHSQGGLRALGYIKQLQNNPSIGSVDKIDAVVTISGIPRGIKMLEGGLAGFKKRASDHVNILGNGLRSAAGVFDLYGILNLLIPRNMLANSYDLFYWMVPEELRPFMLEAWRTTNSSLFPQIDDMIPGSTYITQNVVKTVNQEYKECTGSKLASEWRYNTVLGIKVWYLWIGTVKVYKYYNKTEMIPMFDKKVPLGFIVGTNNKTLSMGDDPTKVKDVKNLIAGLEIGFAVVEGIHIAKCVALVGLLSGSVAYAYDAEQARNYCKNIDAELCNLMGSKESDGFVTKESQYIPKDFLENPILCITEYTDGYAEVKQTHDKMEKDPEAYKIAAKMVEDGYGIRHPEEKR